MYKLTLLAAIGAVAVSGCDFSSSDGDSGVPAPISSIEVSGLTGSNWDDDGGSPDVFVEIRSASGRAFFRSETIDDADLSEALVFDVDEVRISSPTMPLFVAVFDFDDNLVYSQQMANSAPFTTEDLGAGDLELESSAGRIIVR